mgnify:CR=1 FL=1
MIPRILPLVLLAAASAAAQQRWAFDPPPDDFSPAALLDLRGLNEKEAGESGFVRVDEAGDFVLGNGKPARFWAVNTTVARQAVWTPRPRWPRIPPDLARHARFLAKRGVNMVRLHAHINPDVKARPDAAITDINEAERDWIWRTVAAMKKEGIYTTVSPYWPNTMQFNPEWGIPGGAGLAAHALLFFDETMQRAYKSWMRALLAEPNPYTGIPLARDPALAIIQLQNEDSLLFYTVNNLKGPQRDDFRARYSAWVAAKYGSIEEALKAWGGNSVKGDDLAGGLLEFHDLWEMTQNRTGGFARRLADQLQFWTETQYAFHASMAAYLKNELGGGQLVNATNWKSGDPVRLEDAERYSYTPTDVLAKNRYFSGVHNGPNRGWAIVNGDKFTSPSILLDPRAFPLNLKQVERYPMIITESSWVMPMRYAAEGPFLVAAWQSLTGIDAFYWFSTADNEWTPPQSANGYLASQGKWLFGNPDMLGTFPAAALLYRMGYVERGTPVVRETRALEDLWNRRTPIIAESPTYDPNRDAGDIAPQSGVKTGVTPLAFLAGEVRVVYDEDPARTRVADLTDLILDGGKVIRSVTGQHELNTAKGYATLNAPKAQGAAAFFRNQSEFRLADVDIRSGNEYGAVLVVSMDGLPLSRSAKVLVQVGTESRPEGWRETPVEIELSGGQKVSGFEVEDFGKAPWRVVEADVEVTVRNPALRKATVLDMNGNPRGEAALTRTPDSVRLKFPADAMYVVLEAGPAGGR